VAKDNPRRGRRRPVWPPPGWREATSNEVARLALIDLPLKRLDRYEAACRIILGLPKDQRRALAEQILRLIAAARGNLERGHHATWQLTEIERVARKANELVLLPNAGFGQTMRRGGAKGRLLALRGIITPWLVRKPEMDANEVFNRLEEKTVTGTHDVVKEVLRRRNTPRCRTLNCREDYHIHWTHTPGTLRTLGFRRGSTA
jgi:hypothetical protein